MDKKAKKLEIEGFEKRFEEAMPRILKEIAVYEKALKKGILNKNSIPSPQFNLE